MNVKALLRTLLLALLVILAGCSVSKPVANVPATTGKTPTAPPPPVRPVPPEPTTEADKASNEVAAPTPTNMPAPEPPKQPSPELQRRAMSKGMVAANAYMAAPMLMPMQPMQPMQ